MTDRHRVLRIGVVALAAFGVLASLYVAVLLWPAWGDNPGRGVWLVDLSILAGATVLCMLLALRGPRLVAVPAALLLLVWGWFGTWLYGFLWVPGAASMLACLLPRPRPPVPTDPESGAPGA